MFSDNQKISIRQLQIIFIIGILGTGIVFLPQRLASNSKTSGWLSIAVACAIIWLASMLICRVAKLFPSHSFAKSCSTILSKPVTVLISIILFVRLITTAALELRIFSEIVKIFLLKNTPTAVIAVVILLACGYALFVGIEVLARVSEIFLFIIMLPLFFVFTIVAFSCDFTNLLPLIDSQVSIENFSTGMLFTLFGFRGIEIMLIILPFVNKKEKLYSGISQAVLFASFVVIFVVTITSAKFGVSELQHQFFSTLRIMDTVDIPGSFLEKQSALIMSLWIFSFFILLSVYLFCSFSAIKLKAGKNILLKLFCLVCCFALSFVPYDLESSLSILYFLDLTLGSFCIIAIPLIILTVARLRRLGDE